MRENAHCLKLVVIAVLFVVAPQIIRAEPSVTNYVLISFRDGPDRQAKTPVYVLGPEDKLYPVPDENTALYFWGPQWRKNINWWGDKQGLPLPGHLADYMRPKGQPISVKSSWLRPYAASAPAKRNRNNKAQHTDTNEEDEWDRFEVDGREVSAWEGNLDDGSILEATTDMTEKERARFRFRADQKAKHIYALKEDRKALEAKSEKELDATYNTAQQAILNLEARLGRKTHLTAYRFKPGNVYLINQIGEFFPIAVKNGVIDEADYRNARRSSKQMEQMDQMEERMNQLE